MNTDIFLELPTLDAVLATHEYHQYPYSAAYEIDTPDPTEKLVIWENPRSGQVAGHLATIGGTITLNPLQLKTLLDVTARASETTEVSTFTAELEQILLVAA